MIPFIFLWNLSDYLLLSPETSSFFFSNSIPPLVSLSLSYLKKSCQFISSPIKPSTKQIINLLLGYSSLKRTKHEEAVNNQYYSNIRVDAFELWCWRRLLIVPWTARRFNQSILKEISLEYSLDNSMWNSEQVELFKASVTPGSWQGLEQKAKAFLPSFCEAQSLRSFLAKPTHNSRCPQRRGTGPGDQPSSVSTAPTPPCPSSEPAWGAWLLVLPVTTQTH